MLWVEEATDLRQVRHELAVERSPAQYRVELVDEVASVLKLRTSEETCRDCYSVADCVASGAAVEEVEPAVEPGLIGYKDEKLRQVYQQISERMETVPGVQAVTFSRLPLLSYSSSSSSVFLREALSATPDSEGRIKPSGEGYRHTVRENFLTAMGIPLLQGRYRIGHHNRRLQYHAAGRPAFVRA